MRGRVRGTVNFVSRVRVRVRDTANLYFTGAVAVAGQFFNTNYDAVISCVCGEFQILLSIEIEMKAVLLIGILQSYNSNQQYAL